MSGQEKRRRPPFPSPLLGTKCLLVRHALVREQHIRCTISDCVLHRHKQTLVFYMLRSHKGNDCLCFRRRQGLDDDAAEDDDDDCDGSPSRPRDEKERKGGPIIETRDQKLSVFIIAASLKRGILQDEEDAFPLRPQSDVSQGIE